MSSAFIGSVIMSAVTVAMLIAIKVTDNGLSNVGKYPLTDAEKEILRWAGYEDADIRNLNVEIKDIVKLNE